MRSVLDAGRLNSADEHEVQRLLDDEPVENAYLRSELRRGIVGGEWWGVHDGAGISAAVLAGPLAVPCIRDQDDASLLAEAAFAAVPPRMLVGPQRSVLALQRALAAVERPREVRDPQPLLVLDRTDGLPDIPCPVRRALRSDIEALTIAAAAMHREEMGIDPLRIDASAWRARMTALVDSGWSWVWNEGGRVVFKAELSAWNPDVVQIQGVYTDPAYRHRGVAAMALGVICRSLLREVRLCSLYVNHYNGVALRLYDRLGFRRAGDFATVIY
ncbi:MAG: GNAT family N-acetyltransferase [Candidatus Dormibacteraeota bacterium]|nr:GNAT family N-acetyltransferase [Candidatus Dormibacteraeota bacterium]